MSAGTDLLAGRIYQLADGESYAGWLAGRMIDPSCLAESKFTYQISNRIVGSWPDIVGSTGHHGQYTLSWSLHQCRERNSWEGGGTLPTFW